jgi:hypothetical protein
MNGPFVEAFLPSIIIQRGQQCGGAPATPKAASFGYFFVTFFLSKTLYEYKYLLLIQPPSHRVRGVAKMFMDDDNDLFPVFL